MTLIPASPRSSDVPKMVVRYGISGKQRRLPVDQESGQMRDAVSGHQNSEDEPHDSAAEHVVLRVLMAFRSLPGLPWPDASACGGGDGDSPASPMS
jgi:hypothetical protein